MQALEVRVGDKKFVLMISAEKIKEQIINIADQINTQYSGREILILCVLKGSIQFTADLIRNLNMPLKIDFIRLSSYGNQTQSSGKIQELMPTGSDLSDKHVIVVEDIVDSGLTLEYLRKDLESRNVASSAIATLLFKPQNFKGNQPPEFIGFEISNEFVIGYGMDYAENGRQYDSIYQLKE